jgi:hypothetical protein
MMDKVSSLFHVGAMKKSYKTALPTRTRALSLYYQKTGQLVRRPCFFCGSLQTIMHHPDYRRPLVVVFLCRRDHQRFHALLDKTLDSLENSGATDAIRVVRRLMNGTHRS